MLDYDIGNQVDIYTGSKILEFVQKGSVIKANTQHTIGYMHINDKFNPPRSKFAFFIKDDAKYLVLPGHFTVRGNGYTFEHPRFGQDRFVRWSNEIDCIYTVFRDVYVGSHAIVSDGTNLIISGNATGPGWIYESWSGPVVKHVMTGVSLHHGHNSYGHFIADCLFPLMALPKQFLRASTIIHVTPASYVKQFFALLGLTDNIIYLNKEEWVHCDSLISATHPMPHVVHFGTLPYKLSITIREKLNLTAIEPTIYGFMKRTAKTRKILNLDQCMTALRTRVPHIDWQVIDEKLNDFIESAKLHASVKVFGNVCGSNSHHVIFMSPKSVVVYVNTEMWDYSVYFPAISIGMKIIWFMTKGFQHYSNNNCNVERFAKAFEVAAYYAANEKWPDPAQYNAFIDALQ